MKLQGYHNCLPDNGFIILEAYLAYLRGNATEAQAMFSGLVHRLCQRGGGLRAGHHAVRGSREKGTRVVINIPKQLVI